MSDLVIDHIVIGAATLEEGVAYARETLGVEIPPGGEHPLMGTHNRLARLGDNAYLEIIAINPDAEMPKRARWFALDEPDQRRRLAERPRLIAWVAGTQRLESLLAQSPVDLGQPIAASRGDLRWTIALRDDGLLPESGLLPILIQWPGGKNPADRIADVGLKLERLRLNHPAPERLRAMLDVIGATPLVTIEATDGEPGLKAEIRRADGTVVTVQ
jgi:hypothetical protein